MVYHTSHSLRPPPPSHTNTHTSDLFLRLLLILLLLLPGLLHVLRLDARGGSCLFGLFLFGRLGVV